jgi:hypothetical protein
MNTFSAITGRSAYRFFVVTLLTGFVAIPGAIAAERTDGMRFVPDVVNQFKSLAKFADPLGFHQ